MAGRVTEGRERGVVEIRARFSWRTTRVRRYNAEFVRRSRIRFRFTTGVIYNSLIRNSAVAFGVNTLEKEETDNGSLIIGREESNMEIFDTRIVSELSLVGGSR